MIKNHKIYSLSNIQKGLLFEVLCNEKSMPLYIVQMVLALKLRIDTKLFIKAFNIAINQHDILRSFIKVGKGDIDKSYLIVSHKASIPFLVFDLSSLSSDSKVIKFNDYLERDSKKPIDLSSAPLMRIAVFKFSEEDYRIVWTRHHILMGGASVELVIRECFNIYFSLTNKTVPSLSKPIDYTRIQCYEHNIDLLEAESYWKETYCEYDKIGFTPLSFQGSKDKTGKNCIFSLVDNKKYQQLDKFVREHALSVNTMLQASLGILLSSYSARSHVVFGTVRAYPKDIVKNCVGLFINTLPVRVAIDDRSTVLCYLKSLRQRNIDFKKYLNTPLGKIREWCGLPLDIPLYQCVIDYKPSSLDRTLNKEYKQLNCSIFSKLETPYPLVFEVINEEDALKINMHYAVKEFSTDYAVSILEYYKEILCTMISQPKLQIADLPSLRKYDYSLIRSWNETDVDYPLQSTIHTLFEERVKKNPNKTALCYRNRTLSYQFLNERANQLAYYLLRYKNSKEMRVVICLSPCVEIMIAILAVLKAGGIYVPIDPQYPEQRICSLIQDSSPAVVITSYKLFDFFSQINRGLSKNNFALINIDIPLWGNFKKMNPSLPIKSTEGMYVIYTSGSTGKPKGVLVEHSSIVNTALSCIDKLKVTEDSRILQLAPFCFDVSVAEWCMTLLSGATLYLLDKDVFSPTVIMQALKNYKITTIILSSSMLAALPHEHLPDLQVIAPGGESVDQHTLDFWSRNRLFINVYGITETAICSTMAVHGKNNCSSIIGKPLPNTNVMVLNELMRSAPIGVPGEIYIGGAGVARGYFNNQTMTQCKFLSNMLSSKGKDNATRFYKTGDIGRWLPDGNLEFVNRVDDQVKIRGFRVELPEIERAIEAFPGIYRAIAVAHQQAGAKVLYAFFIESCNVAVDRLREFLSNRLPNYMLPTKFIKIDEIPLTPNGKVDKKKLLVIMSNEKSLKTEQCSSSNSVLEYMIIGLIKEILKCKHIEKDKNFLDYGFNSLSLVTFSVALSKKLNRKLDVTILFTYPTVDLLTGHLNNENIQSDAVEFKQQHYFPCKPTAGKLTRIRFSDEEQI